MNYNSLRSFLKSILKDKILYINVEELHKSYAVEVPIKMYDEYNTVLVRRFYLIIDKRNEYNIEVLAPTAKWIDEKAILEDIQVSLHKLYQKWLVSEVEKSLRFG